MLEPRYWKAVSLYPVPPFPLHPRATPGTLLPIPPVCHHPHPHLSLCCLIFCLSVCLSLSKVSLAGSALAWSVQLYKSIDLLAVDALNAFCLFDLYWLIYCIYYVSSNIIHSGWLGSKHQLTKMYYILYQNIFLAFFFFFHKKEWYHLFCDGLFIWCFIS